MACSLIIQILDTQKEMKERKKYPEHHCVLKPKNIEATFNKIIFKLFYSKW